MRVPYGTWKPFSQMKSKKRIRDEKAPLQIIEEAIFVLKQCSTAAWAAYFAGTIPFLLLFLFFWADMSRSPFAASRCTPLAFALALLYLWMKTWQAVFVRFLKNVIQDNPTEDFTALKLGGIAITQSALQPLSLILLPVGFILCIPFPYLVALFQNILYFGDGETASLREVLGKSMRTASVWIAQSFKVISILSLLSVFVFLNFGMLVYLISSLLVSFTGINTIFSTASTLIFLNSTFLVVVGSLTFLCIDPLIKAVYALRCFYAASRASGNDLHVDLKVLKKLALTCFIIYLLTPVSAIHAAEDDSQGKTTTINQTELNREIEKTVRDPEFSWRIPRDSIKEENVIHPDTNFLDTFFTDLGIAIKNGIAPLKAGIKKLFTMIGDFGEWLTNKKLKKSNSSESSFFNSGGLGYLGLGALLCLGLVLAIVLIRYLKKNWIKAASVIPDIGTPVVVPDIMQEEVSAAQLPEEGWLQMAEEFLTRGEYRLALRAIYLASLAMLARVNLITIAKSKSNMEYQRELNRKSHAFPNVSTVFAENLNTFESTWYGLHQVDSGTCDTFRKNHDRIRTHVEG